MSVEDQSPIFPWRDMIRVWTAPRAAAREILLQGRSLEAWTTMLIVVLLSFPLTFLVEWQSGALLLDEGIGGSREELVPPFSIVQNKFLPQAIDGSVGYILVILNFALIAFAKSKIVDKKIVITGMYFIFSAELIGSTIYMIFVYIYSSMYFWNYQFFIVLHNVKTFILLLIFLYPVLFAFDELLSIYKLYVSSVFMALMMVLILLQYFALHEFVLARTLPDFFKPVL